MLRLGFDPLTIGLALAVIGFHGVVTSHGARVGREVAPGLARPFINAILLMFFAPSGLLVAARLVRSKTRTTSQNPPPAARWGQQRAASFEFPSRCDATPTSLSN